MADVERDEKGLWLSGKSANPDGRPKDDNSWAGIFRRIGESSKIDIVITNADGVEKRIYFEAGDEKDKAKFKHVVGSMVWAQAVSGNLKAVEMIMDRTEGKVTQALDIKAIKDRPAFDLSKLSDKELELFSGLLKKLESKK